MNDKCNECPINGVCIGQKTGWEVYCRLAVSEVDSERDSVVFRSAMFAKEIEGAPSENRPIEPPSLMRQAGSLLSAGAKFVANGLKIVPQEEYDRRRGICQSCDFLDKKHDRCLKCGCYLAVKPWSKAEHCPISKW